MAVSLRNLDPFCTLTLRRILLYQDWNFTLLTGWFYRLDFGKAVQFSRFKCASMHFHKREMQTRRQTGMGGDFSNKQASCRSISSGGI